MGNLLADIFVTIKPTGQRLPLSVRSLESLRDNTERSQYRLTVCIDGTDLEPAGWTAHLMTFLDGDDDRGFADYILSSRENVGLGPTINRAIAHIKTINDWHLGPAGDPSQVAPYTVMCQDDLLYTPGWLHTLASRFQAYSHYRPGFATGHYATEHAQTIRRQLGEGIHLQDWIRASQMLATREYWQSLMPIPALDPETKRLRAKPNDGMGSGVDWWLIRNHENSICRTGRTCLVIPGLVQHAGFDRSTWLTRELPESESDKEAIANG